MTKDVASVRFRGINEGRMAAREVDLFLENNTNLPVTGGELLRLVRERGPTYTPELLDYLDEMKASAAPPEDKWTAG